MRLGAPGRAAFRPAERPPAPPPALPPAAARRPPARWPALSVSLVLACTCQADYRDSAPEPLEDVVRLYAPVVQHGRWTHGLIEMWWVGVRGGAGEGAANPSAACTPAALLPLPPRGAPAPPIFGPLPGSSSTSPSSTACTSPAGTRSSGTRCAGVGPALAGAGAAAHRRRPLAPGCRRRPRTLWLPATSHSPRSPHACAPPSLQDPGGVLLDGAAPDPLGARHVCRKPGWAGPGWAGLGWAGLGWAGRPQQRQRSPLRAVQPALPHIRAPRSARSRRTAAHPATPPGREYVMPVRGIGRHGFKSDIKALCWM